MKVQRAPAAIAEGSDLPHTSERRLHGSRLVIVRVTWVIVIVLTLGRFIAAVPVHYHHWSTPDENVLAGLLSLGISVHFYATYRIALAIVFVLVYCAVAAVIVWHKSDDWQAVFVSLLLVTFGVNVSFLFTNLGADVPLAGWLALCLEFLGWIFISLFFFLFPNGRFVPHWTWLLALCIITLQVPWTFFPASPLSPDTWPPELQALVFLLVWGSGVVAQVYRYRRVSGPIERQQTKWVVFGATVAVVGGVGLSLPGLAIPALAQPGSLYLLAIATLGPIPFLCIPLTIGVAIQRYRLWNIDPIINRTLVYSMLTMSIIGLYVLVVGYLGIVFRTNSNPLISLVATGLIAVLFQPLRDRLQRAVNRLMYGERDDPYAVLARLGQRLEVTLAADAVLPTIVETVAQALRLPYVAIALDRNGASMIVAYGTPVPVSLTLPLIYGAEIVGQLLLAPRVPGEDFSAADQRLLEDLARQAGIAVHAVRLTRDLQQSREHLVITREEERLRLRRDLHDGLGPTLAGFTLTVAAIRNLLGRDQAAADALLSEMGAEIEAAVGDIRRLVYDLRPPALDELGLVGAIRTRAAQYSANLTGGLQVHVEVLNDLAVLPAAVEVAAYRITEEALLNVVRHARARTCVVRLSLAEALRLEICDDGVGLPMARHMGVGLHSLRERAAELGGSCVVESVPTGGTRVCALLPLP
jgi:signal transduction histidine kinase